MTASCNRFDPCRACDRAGSIAWCGSAPNCCRIQQARIPPVVGADWQSPARCQNPVLSRPVVKPNSILTKPPLIKALAPHSFAAQSDGPDLFMVRKSEIAGLFERVEFLFAGRRHEVVLVTLAISIVWRVVNQMNGLMQRGGFPGVCPDPDSGKVRFATAEQANAWAAQVGAIAPRRTAALAREKGPALLHTTEAARTAAAEAFRRFIEPTSDLQSIREEASAEQKRTIDNALTRPFAISAPELELVSSASIAALVRMNDPDVLKLGQVATTPARDPRIRLDQLLAVPDLAIWKVRVLTDLILQRDHEES